MSLQDIAWIGSGLSGLAGLLGLSIASFQLSSLRKSISNSNLMAVFNIEFELNRRKERLAAVRQKGLELIAGRDATQIPEAEMRLVESHDAYRKEAYEDYLNAFDRLSFFILNGKLDESDFRLEFRDMLFDTMEDDPEGMFGPTTRYRNMKKLYDRWKDM